MIPRVWQPHRVAAAPGELAPDAGEPAPERLSAESTDRTVRGHRAPRVLQPSGVPDVTSEDVRVGDQRVGHRNAENARTGLEREPEVAVAADVDAGQERGGREARRQEVDRLLALQGAALRRHSTSAGLVEEQQHRCVRELRGQQIFERSDPCPYGLARGRNATLVGRPACSSATRGSTVPTIWTLTRGGDRTLGAHCVEKREEARVRRGAERGFDQLRRCGRRRCQASRRIPPSLPGSARATAR